MNDLQQYTAIDLLDKIIEITRITNYSKEWSLEMQMKNKPRFVRLQQIHSLMWAFIEDLYITEDIQGGIESIYSGEFFLLKPIEDYKNLLDLIYKTIAKSDFIGVKERELNIYDLQENYCNLLSFYLQLNKLVNHNKGIMEISYPYLFPYLVTKDISQSIDSEAKKIRAILASCIDPYNNKYTELELISKFDYPTDDLFEIDIDWK